MKEAVTRKQDVKRTLTATAAVTLRNIVELEAALQSGGLVFNEQKQKERKHE